MPCHSALYKEFVQSSLQDEFQRLFTEYPVLSSTVATCTEQWISATADFLNHFRPTVRNWQRGSMGATIPALLRV